MDTFIPVYLNAFRDFVIVVKRRVAGLNVCFICVEASLIIPVYFSKYNEPLLPRKELKTLLLRKVSLFAICLEFCGGD